MLEKPNFQPFTVKQEEDASRIRSLTQAERIGLGLDEAPTDLEGGRAAEVLQATWKNPESQVERAIEIDINKEIESFAKMYQDNLGLSLDRQKITEIWNSQFAEIKAEIEKYGYDMVLLIPDNLPSVQEINTKLIETMDEGANGQVAATYQSGNFQQGGSFAGVKNTAQSGCRIVLTKNEQNIKGTTDPLLKATLNKNIISLTGLTGPEINTRMQSGTELPISFTTKVGAQDIDVKAEGLSLAEYMILQRSYFDKTQTHLDEDGWTWLTKSGSGSRVVRALWAPGVRQLRVAATDPSDSAVDLGLRLSRSFG